MATYDKTDLKSTLNYIKNEYGTACFKDGKAINLLSDLAPTLKRERSLLKKLVDKGLLKEIAENASSNETEQRRIVFKTKNFLIGDEFLQEDIAVAHINILAEIFNYNSSSILRVSNQTSNTEATALTQKELTNNAIETIKCSFCGYDNPKGNKFCGSCGGDLLTQAGIKCQNCGYENPITNKLNDSQKIDHRSTKPSE